MEKHDTLAAMYPLLSVEQALHQILSYFHPLETEQVSLLEALDRVLAEDVYASLDVPPHSNAAMDGYAVRAADTQGASRQTPKRLRIIADLAAGYVTATAVTAGTAIRIMTGAPIPEGADAVIRFEDTERQGEWVNVFAEVAVGQEIRRAGEDVARGTQVLKRGTRLRPADIGMLATLGHAQVTVTRRPRVAILATGDEVLEPGLPLQPGKIYNANSYSNAAQVLKYGGIPFLLGIARDDVQALTEKIRAGVAQNVDLFLVSGGVSVGDFDMVKEVLAAEGEITLWRVRMKPGRPMAFGRIQNIPLLAMPGNPVSAMVSFELFARPAILTMLGVPDVTLPTIEAILLDEIKRKDERRHYVRVQIEQKGHDYYARLTGDQGSGILSSMVKANGLAILPEEWNHVPAGTRVQVVWL